MSEKKALLDIEGNIGVIRLNDPAALNAVSMGMLRDLKDVFDQVEDPATGLRAVVFTGNGRGFCAGANLADPERRERQASSNDAGSVLEEWYHPMLTRVRNLPIPYITAVNGVAAGVGMSLALMGDLVLAAKSSYFLQAFRRIGLVPDGGSTWLLPRLIGMARAKELSIMADKLPAETALEWGLINRVHDDDQLLPEAMKLADQLANGPTTSLKLIRKLYWHSFENDYASQLHMEREAQREAGSTDDFREGVQAFLEKRPAKFTGK